MAVERTFSIIKPDATRRNLTGKINARFEEAGPAHRRPEADPPDQGSRPRSSMSVHSERPFFDELVAFMTSGPVVVQVLEGENAVPSQPRHHGRHQPGQCRGRHHPQGLRRSRSRPTRSTVRTALRTPPARSSSSSARAKSFPDRALFGKGESDVSADKAERLASHADFELRDTGCGLVDPTEVEPGIAILLKPQH